MAKQHDGGPAFPRSGYYPDTSDCDFDTTRERLPSVTEPQPGMTLRDYFAGQAIMGVLANSDLPDLFAKGFAPSKAAEIAYMVAEAMIEARDAVQPTTPDAPAKRASRNQKESL